MIPSSQDIRVHNSVMRFAQGYCKNPCIAAMMGCMDDSTFRTAVGPKTLKQLQPLQKMCKDGGGGAGDGKCDVLSLGKYMTAMEKKGGVPSARPAACPRSAAMCIN